MRRHVKTWRLLSVNMFEQIINKYARTKYRQQHESVTHMKKNIVFFSLTLHLWRGWSVWNVNINFLSKYYQIVMFGLGIFLHLTMYWWRRKKIEIQKTSKQIRLICDIFLFFHENKMNRTYINAKCIMRTKRLRRAINSTNMSCLPVLGTHRHFGAVTVAVVVHCGRQF